MAHSKKISAPGTGLPLDKLVPSLQAALCYRYTQSVLEFTYRVGACHLLLIESGGIIAHPPGGRFEAKAGDLVCFRAADVNRYKICPPIVYYQTHLQFAAPPRHQLIPDFGDLGEWPAVLPLGESFEEARFVFETFCLEISQSGMSHALRLRAAVFELLAIVNNVLARRKDTAPHLDDWERLRIRLNARLNENIRVHELAHDMHISPHHFIRQFKRRFGTSPKAFHLQARLHEAARLLRTTKLSVKSIATDIGFSHAESMARAFKLHCGVTPSQIRAGSIYAARKLPPTKAGHSFFINRFYLPPNTPPNWGEQFVAKFPRAK